MQKVIASEAVRTYSWVPTFEEVGSVDAGQGSISRIAAKLEQLIRQKDSLDTSAIDHHYGGRVHVYLKEFTLFFPPQNLNQRYEYVIGVVFDIVQKDEAKLKRHKEDFVNDAAVAVLSGRVQSSKDNDFCRVHGLHPAEFGSRLDVDGFFRKYRIRVHSGTGETEKVFDKLLGVRPRAKVG